CAFAHWSKRERVHGTPRRFGENRARKEFGRVGDFENRNCIPDARGYGFALTSGFDPRLNVAPRNIYRRNLRHELAPRYFERQMAWPSAAPDSGARADGDVARRAHLRSALAMGRRWQRERALVVLRDCVRAGRVAACRADGLDRLERN